MRKTIVLLAAMAAMVVVYAGAALAAPVSDVEPNDSIATAQNVDASFSLDADPNISNDPTGTENTSTTVPHATIDGTGDGTYDYYSFTVPEGGGIGSFDIDGAYPGFDSVLRLYNSNGGLLAANDDNLYVDPGSLSPIRDSYLRYPFPGAGTYYIKVSSYVENVIDAGASYKLNVSIPNHPVQVIDNIAPTVTSTIPQNGTRNVLKTANLTAGFSEAVQNVNTTTFKLERKKGPAYLPVVATVTTLDNDTTAVLDPSLDLPKGDYRATITSGVTDTAGNELSAPYTWTFKVSR
jgi:hypothetical protein